MRWFPLALLVLLAGCDWFTPPCVKVARKVCDVGSEGDACAFILNLQRGDEHAQNMCSSIAAAASDLAADPKSGSAQEQWRAARAQLAQLGFVTDPLKGRIENKLKAAGGTAGKIVESLERSSALGEKKISDSAEQALDSANK